MKKINIGNTAGKVLILLLSIVTLYPFYSMIIMSTYKSEQLMTAIRFLPGDYLIENIKTVFATDFGLYYWNSIYIAVISTFGAVLFSSMAGYAFAKFNFKGKTVLFTIVLSTIMIPQQLSLIGFVMELRLLKLASSHFGLIVPAMARAYFIFWMTAYMKTAIPNEVLESARIDGAGEFRTFFMIVFPIIRPAVITVFLLAFLFSWNRYLTPLVLLSDEDLFTIPIAIAKFNTEYRTDYSASILALTLATLPMIILFSFGSKYLIKGLASGSVKG
jgi:cellobiose transport system permease protein